MFEIISFGFVIELWAWGRRDEWDIYYGKEVSILVSSKP